MRRSTVLLLLAAVLLGAAATYGNFFWMPQIHLDNRVGYVEMVRNYQYTIDIAFLGRATFVLALCTAVAGTALFWLRDHLRLNALRKEKESLMKKSRSQN